MSYLFELGSEILAHLSRRAIAHSSRQTVAHTCWTHEKRHGGNQSDSGAWDITARNNPPDLLLRWRAWVAHREVTYPLENLRPDMRP